MKSYYAVIFTSQLSNDTSGYEEMAERMVLLAKSQKGFIGIDSARNVTGITVSYWETLEDIRHWKQNAHHLLAQQLGKEKWYKAFTVRICKVEREYTFGES